MKPPLVKTIIQKRLKRTGAVVQIRDVKCSLLIRL